MRTVTAIILLLIVFASVFSLLTETRKIASTKHREEAYRLEEIHRAMLNTRPGAFSSMLGKGEEKTKQALKMMATPQALLDRIEGRLAKPTINYTVEYTAKFRLKSGKDGDQFLDKNGAEVQEAYPPFTLVSRDPDGWITVATTTIPATPGSQVIVHIDYEVLNSDPSSKLYLRVFKSWADSTVDEEVYVSDPSGSGSLDLVWNVEPDQNNHYSFNVRITAQNTGLGELDFDTLFKVKITNVEIKLVKQYQGEINLDTNNPDYAYIPIEQIPTNDGYGTDYTFTVTERLHKDYKYVEAILADNEAPTTTADWWEWRNLQNTKDMKLHTTYSVTWEPNTQLVNKATKYIKNSDTFIVTIHYTKTAATSYISNAIPEYNWAQSEWADTSPETNRVVDIPGSAPESGWSGTLWTAVYSAHYWKILKIGYFEVDIGPPQLRYTAPTGWLRGTVSISFTATDQAYVEEVWAEYSGNILARKTYTNKSSVTDTLQIDTIKLPNGQVTIYIKAKDTFGKICSVSVTLKIDNEAPTIRITSAPTPNNKIYVEWSGSDAHSGIDHYEVMIENATWSSGWINVGTQTSYTLTNVSECEYTVYIKAIDNTGNEATTQTTITIDKTKPTLGAAYWAHGIWSPNNDTSDRIWTELYYESWVTDQAHQGVTIRIQLTDNYGIDSITLKLIGQLSGDKTSNILGYTYNGTYLYVWLETQNIIDGDTLTLSTTAQDLAGNSNSKDYVFKLDNALPGLQTTNYLYEYGYYYQSVYYYGGEHPVVNITAIITDSGDNLVYINVSLKSPTEEIWIIEFTWSGVEWSYNALIQGVISVCVDGNQSWVRISVRTNITSLAEGNYEAKIYAKDDAGYKNSWSNNMKVDWSPPRNLRIWLESYDIDNPSTWSGNYSIICGQWYFYYSVEDYYDFEIVIKENSTGTILPTPTNGSIWDLTEPAIRSGIFIITFSAWDEVGNKAVIRYIIAVEHNDPYPLVNNTKSGGSIDASGEFVLLISLDIAGTHVYSQGWPTGLKWFVVYLDGEALLNMSFGAPNNYWDRYYSPDGWYNISIILNETYLTPGSHIIKIVTQGMSYWDTEWFTYTLNYKPRVRITLLNSSVYWGQVDIWFNVTDIIGRPLSGRLNITLAGELYSLSVTGGSAVLSYIYLTPGTYTFNVSYSGDGLPAFGEFSVSVLVHGVAFDVDYPSVLYVGGYYEVYVYNIIDLVTGTVPSESFELRLEYTWVVNGSPASTWIFLTSGTATSAWSMEGAWEIADLNGDGIINSADYYVYLRLYINSELYEGEKVVGPILVKQVPEISMTQQSDTLVYTDYGEFLIDTNVPNAFIQVYYWDNTYGWVWNGTYTTDSQGNAIVSIYVPDVGTVKYKVILNETDHYQEGEAEFEFNAVAESVYAQIKSVGTWRYSDQATIVVYFEDDDSSPAIGLEFEIRVEYNGSWLTIGQGTTNSSGYGVVLTTCWLGEGTYTLRVVVIDDKYVGDDATMSISVQKEIVTKIDAKVEAGQLIVSVIDDENTSLPRIPVEIIYNGSVIADSTTNDQGKAIFNVAGYEGKQITVRIKDNPYSETKETKVTIPQNYVSGLNQNRWIVVVFALALAGIALIYYYRRGEGYAFDESLSFGMENGNIITLERRNGNNIVPKENLEEEL